MFVSIYLSAVPDLPLPDATVIPQLKALGKGSGKLIHTYMLSFEEQRY